MVAKDSDIILTGYIEGNELSDIMGNAGLFVLPSDLEGLSLALIEAMYEGIPVVASDIPPNQELIGSNRGLLFKAGDLESCTSCLKQALSCLPKLKRMAKEAQKHVEVNYNWNQIFREYLNLYENQKID